MNIIIIISQFNPEFDEINKYQISHVYTLNERRNLSEADMKKFQDARLRITDLALYAFFEFSTIIFFIILNIILLFF